MRDFKEEIIQKCSERGIHLAYLTEFGSHLYGLNTKTSDRDFKGLFIPNLDDCVLGNIPKSISFNTRTDNREGVRNSAEDVDVELWSIQYYFQKLLPTGDTGAIDLLFSYFSRSNLYCDSAISNMFKEYGKLFDSKNMKAYIGYALGQASRYGCKGSRLSVIRGVRDFLRNKICLDNSVSDSKLGIFFDEILSGLGDPSLCFSKEMNGGNMLFICGKGFGDKISVGEACTRLCNEFDKYGERAIKAEKEEGIDWKALSHAVRCCYQTEELLQTGFIKFPFDEERKRILLDIKTGKLQYRQVATLIEQGLDNVKKAQEESVIDFKFSKVFVENSIIMEIYNVG